MNRDHSLYKILSNPVTQEKLAEAYSLGLFKKEDLKDGQLYVGHCRNARIARWNASKQRFTYLRHKFGSSFFEDIVHPVDDEGFDVFTTASEISSTLLHQDFKKVLSLEEGKEKQRALRDFSYLLDAWLDVESATNIEVEMMIVLLPLVFDKTQIRWLSLLSNCLSNEKVVEVILSVASSLDKEKVKAVLDLQSKEKPDNAKAHDLWAQYT